MAAGTIPEPGKVVRGVEIGPCVDDCDHTDCKQSREMAETECPICGDAIGYETPFYDRDGVLVHAACAEDQQ